VCAAATGFAMMAVARIILGLAVFAVFAVLSHSICGPLRSGDQRQVFGGDRT